MSENVGKISRDLLMKGDKNDHTVVEQMQEQLSDYEANVVECMDAGKKVYSGPFYITVLTKKEKLMENVLRHYFFHRATCPTPDYDQAVYRYCPINAALEFLWVIPDKDTCYYLRDNALVVDPKERQLLQYVLELFDDTLMLKAKRLNGELVTTPFLEKGIIC
jgi:hypothetical protein